MQTTTSPLARPSLAAALVRRAALLALLCALTATLTATWLSSAPASANPSRAAAPAKAAPAARPPAKGAPSKAAAARAAEDDDDAEPRKPSKPRKEAKTLSGKLNLNTATVEQLSLLPGVGPSKAERVIAWRQKHGGFKRVQDLRKVKGFGYKTLKKLEPYLDIKGETTLAAR